MSGFFERNFLSSEFVLNLCFTLSLPFHQQILKKVDLPGRGEGPSKGFSLILPKDKLIEQNTNTFIYEVEKYRHDFTYFLGQRHVILLV